MSKLEDYSNLFILFTGTIASLLAAILTFPRFSVLQLFFGWTFFVLTSIATLLGFYAVYFTGNDIVAKMSMLEKHTCFTYLAIVIGFPLLTAFIYNVHYPSPFSFIFSIFAGLHSVFYLLSSEMRKREIEVIFWLIVFFRLYIAILTENIWGIAGALMMGLNIMSFLYPTESNFFGMSSFFAIIIGLGIASHLEAKAMDEMLDSRLTLHTIIPF